MSKEVVSEVNSNPEKGEMNDVQKVQPSEEKQNEESNSRHSGRQVTINEDVASVKETSFIDETIESQPVSDQNETIYNPHSLSTDDIINTGSTHDIIEDTSNEKEDEKRPKCLQCLSEVFECTIWFFKSCVSSTRSRMQNCCCNKNSMDIKNKELDDDGEYWNGNLMNGDEGGISFSFDNKEDVNETNGSFRKTDSREVIIDHSKDNKGFEDIDIKTTQPSKEVNETRHSSSKEVGHRNSTTNAVCHVNVHHGSHEHTNVSNVGSRHDTSVVNDGGNSGGNDGGNSGGNNGGNDDSNSGGNDGGNSDGNHSGYDGGNDGGAGGGDVVDCSASHD